MEKFPFICWFEKTSSTQDEFKAALQKHAVPEYAVIAAREQTRGRGRQGNSWHAQPGKNALFSVYIPGEFQLKQTEQIYQTLAVAVIRSLRNAGCRQAVIKYPNDILVRGKKLAGILVETNIKQTKISRVRAGIGVNVLQTNFPPGLHATSLLSETGRTHDITDIITETVRQIKVAFQQPPEKILHDFVYFWHQQGTKKGLIAGGQKIEGKIIHFRNDLIYLDTGKQIRTFPVNISKPWL